MIYAKLGEGAHQKAANLVVRVSCKLLVPLRGFIGVASDMY